MRAIIINEADDLRTESALLYDVAQVLTIIYGDNSFTIDDLFRRLDTTWFNIKRDRFVAFMNLQVKRLTDMQLIEPGVSGALIGFKLNPIIVRQIQDEHVILGTVKDETINHGALAFLKIFIEKVIFNNNWVNGTSIREEDIYYGFPMPKPNIKVDIKAVDHFANMVEYCKTHTTLVKREDRRYKNNKGEPTISKFNKAFIKILLEVTPKTSFKFSFANKHFTSLNKVANKNKCASSLYTLTRTGFLTAIRNTDHAIIFNEYRLTDKAHSLSFE